MSAPSKLRVVGAPSLRVDDGFSHVLIGWGARVSPGIRIPIGERNALRVALRTELSGTSMARGGIGLLTSAGDPVFRLGGFELSTGLTVGGWFGLPSR